MFSQIFDAIEEWMRELLTGMITSNLDTMFTDVNQKTGEIATQVGQTPQGWNGSIFSMIRNLSDSVIMPIAGIIITLVLCYELISMLTERNNMHDIDTWMFFKYFVKMWIAVYLVSNTFTITMAVFDVGQHVVNSAAGVITGSTAIDISSALTDLSATLESMEIGELVVLALETLIAGFCMRILSVLITVIMYGRMIEIYLYTSVAPIPFATMSNREWGQIGTNYFRGLFALAFQAFLMMVCVAIYLPYQEARQQNVSITVENYRLISIHEMQENEKVADIWKRTKNQCEVSDVLVLNKNGEISCYYVDENYPQYLAGFIRINTSGALITMETENYQIDGKKGNWIATDTVIIDGKQFYLMEHQVYRDQAQGVILDAYGKMVVEECKKFDEKTKQKIHDYIQQQVPLNPVEQLKQDGKIRLEHYQKFYQNGTYERSRESGTEANYDMVDGLVNNQKKNLEKISDARNNKQTSRNQQNNKPKKRRSVIKRLHQKQIAIARRSGKPIPKYLDQEMERKRG